MQDKDAIIARQDTIIARLTQQVETLLKRIAQLEDEIARLKNDSNNSYKPPSSDIVKPRQSVRKTARKKKKRPNYSLFRIDQSRGSQVLFEMLGQEYEGIIGCDFWGAYRKFARLTNATVQYCMAHLIREIRFVAEHTNKSLARWGNQLLAWLRKLFKTLHRSDAWTDAGFAKRMNRIKKDFLSRMRRAPSHKLAKNLARRFKGRAAETYFRFLTDPAVEPTNNGTEREIRHSVIDRRITQGTRGDAGMRWCERIWTTIATCKKQNRNVFKFLHNSLLADWTGKGHPLLL